MTGGKAFKFVTALPALAINGRELHWMQQPVVALVAISMLGCVFVL